MTATARILEIQRFSLHDGPGIRSLVFFKGCPLHCPWCQNPESQNLAPEIAFYKNRCQETFLCEQACPEHAILREGFRIDRERCSGCNRCIDACAHDALRLLGQLYTPEQLMREVLVDRPYYDSSGGGITFSGGEPTLHPLFIDQVLDLCARESLHTNMETAGTFSFERWEPILRKLDLIYFDMKILDPELHRKHLGGGYANIERNAARLVAGGFPVEFRLPLIPRFTDTRANIEQVIRRLRELGKSTLHVLPYNAFGEAKIDLIAGKQPKLGLMRPTDEAFNHVVTHFENHGIHVIESH